MKLPSGDPEPGYVEYWARKGLLAGGLAASEGLQTLRTDAVPEQLKTLVDSYSLLGSGVRAAAVELMTKFDPSRIEVFSSMPNMSPEVAFVVVAVACSHWHHTGSLKEAVEYYQDAYQEGKDEDFQAGWDIANRILPLLLRTDLRLLGSSGSAGEPVTANQQALLDMCSKALFLLSLEPLATVSATAAKQRWRVMAAKARSPLSPAKKPNASMWNRLVSQARGDRTLKATLEARRHLKQNSSPTDSLVSLCERQRRVTAAM